MWSTCVRAMRASACEYVRTRRTFESRKNHKKLRLANGNERISFVSLNRGIACGASMQYRSTKAYMHGNGWRSIETTMAYIQFSQLLRRNRHVSWLTKWIWISESRLIAKNGKIPFIESLCPVRLMEVRRSALLYYFHPMGLGISFVFPEN